MGLLDLPIIGDIINTAGSIWNNERNIDMQQDTNAQNYRMFQEANEFNAAESQKGRDFNAAEAEKARNFNAQESLLNREFQTGEREAAQRFNESMYKKYQSPSAQADAYTRLGINPASLAGHSFQGVQGSSGMQGSMAAASPAASGFASSAAPPHFQAPHSDNPISLQSLNSQSQLFKAQASNQQIKNMYEAQRQEAEINTEIEKCESFIKKQGLDEQEKRETEHRIEILKLQRNLLDNQFSDLTEQASLDTFIKQNQVKQQTLSIVAQTFQNDVLPQLLSSQIGLNESSAQALVTQAAAAFKNALSTEYDSKTRRSQLHFDMEKWKKGLNKQIDAITRHLNAQSDVIEETGVDVARSQEGVNKTQSKLNLQNVSESKTRIFKMINDAVNSDIDEIRQWIPILGWF